nr:MAG TPA: hypothetical protein [Caudoviricetes sp.]
MYDSTELCACQLKVQCFLLFQFYILNLSLKCVIFNIERRKKHYERNNV